MLFLALACACAPAPLQAESFQWSTFPTGVDPQGVTLSDFDLDGNQDLAVAVRGGDRVWVYPGIGDGTFGPSKRYDTGAFPYRVATGDIDGDGYDDLVVAGRDADSARILLSEGTGEFGPNGDVALGTEPTSVVLGDFDLDGNLDLASGNALSIDTRVREGLGDGSFGDETFVQDHLWGSHYHLMVNDMNVDGLPDLLAATGGFMSGALLSQGDLTFEFIGYPWNFGGDDFLWGATADVDQDGDPDVVWSESDFFDVCTITWQGDGSGGAILGSDVWITSWEYQLEFGEFNGDGDPDMVATRDGGLAIRYGSVGDTFVGTPVHPIQDGVNHFTVGDLNGDGLDDIVASSSGADQVVVGLTSTDCGPPLQLALVEPAVVPALTTDHHVEVIVHANSLCGFQGVTVDGVVPNYVGMPDLDRLVLWMPLVPSSGEVDVEVVANGVTATYPMFVEPPAEPVVKVGPGGLTTGVGGTLHYAADPGDWVFLFASTSGAPSILPGVAEFGIGQGFQSLYGVLGDVITDKAWNERFLPIGPIAPSTKLYFQAAIYEPDVGTLPLTMSNVHEAWIAWPWE